MRAKIVRVDFVPAILRKPDMDLAIKKMEAGQDLTALNWQGVRAEYFKVWADFPVIAKPFGITLSQDQVNALGHLLISMDLIDSAIDREVDQRTRENLCQSILKWMSRETDKYPLAETIDTDRLNPLRELVTRRGISAPFLTAASTVFLASERKRNSKTVSGFVQSLIDEGQSAAEMTIEILGQNTNDPFNDFLQRVMRIGTIVDTLLDANDDFEKGILNLHPNLVFRLRLKTAIAIRLPGLILAFPNSRLLWRYCLSYTRDQLSPLGMTA
jgi:hypothetical protein